MVFVEVLALEVSKMFKDWIGQFKGQEKPIGDLADDVCRDKTFPDSDDYETLLNYISNRSRGNEAVVSTFKRAWKKYHKPVE